MEEGILGQVAEVELEVVDLGEEDDVIVDDELLGEEEVKETEPSFTQEQVNEIIDKRLLREKQKAELLRKKAVEEAVRKSKLTKKELEAEELVLVKKELEELKAERERDTLITNIGKKLKEQGIPSVFTEALVLKEDEELIDLEIENLKGELEEYYNKRMQSVISQPEPEVERTGVLQKVEKKTRADIFK